MQSRFVSLTPYCLVEYIFEPLGSLNFLTEDFILMQNNHVDSHQIFNLDGSFSRTRNIRDLSAVPMGNGKFAYSDSEKIPNYLDYDTEISYSTLSGYNVVYDKVKFHFISGFDLNDFEGLILSIRNRENSGKTNIFANILVSPETIDELITFNPKPLFVSDSLYDRFIEIKVPSIKNINEELSTALTPASTFAAQITPTSIGYDGFITNSPITVNLSECGKRERLNTNAGVKYDVFEVTENYDASVSQSNEFDGVGAFVGESTNGDFIEYYLTFNSGFPEELISILNRRNPSNDWIIIHQLSVFEQVGTAFINTSRQVMFQEDSFDEPMVFRPVLKNAGQAISMSIDLLVRLVNRLNGEQIIREASFTLLSPKKYGRNLTTIPLSDEPQSQKVYNKLIQKNFEATNLFIEPTFAPGFDTELNPDSEVTVVTQVEYVPIFFSNNNICVSNTSAMLKTTDTTDEVIFKPGKLRFVLSPFDNSIRLKLYEVINQKPVPIDLNLNAAKYAMVFDTDSGKVRILNENSSKVENLSNGEIRFKVPNEESEKIVKSSNQTIYITAISQNGDETLMYTGEWRLPSQQADVDSAIELAKQEAEDRDSLEQRLSDLDDRIRSIESRNDKLRSENDKNRFIKKKAVVPVVNRIGMISPKKVKTNVSNAGKGS
jgi:hypothetical protein